METTRTPGDTATSEKSKFGFWSIVFLTINGIIGTGIFLSPGAVITEAGAWTPVVYIAAGVFACILALTFAAAARWTSENGASFAYARVAFGDDVGFYVGITRFVAGAIAWGVMATAVVSTSLGIFFGSDAASSTRNITIGFVVLMTVLFVINIAGTRITKIFTNASTLGKVAALVITIAAAVFLVVKTGDNQFGVLDGLKGDDGKPAVPAMDAAVFVGAVLAAFYAFTGFETIATAASEMDRPEKLLPRAIPLGVFIVLLVYVGVVTATMMLDPVALLKSEEPVVLASAFENEIVRGLIITGALISMFGINVGASFITPRVFEAMSARGMVPAVVSRTNSRGVPVVAFVITAVLAMAIPMAFAYDMKGIMVISAVSRFIQFVVVPVAVIVFFARKARHRTHDARRNVLLDVVIPIIAFVSSIYLMVKFDWSGEFSSPDGGTNVWAVSAMVVGYVVLPLALYIPWKMGLVGSRGHHDPDLAHDASTSNEATAKETERE